MGAAVLTLLSEGINEALAAIGHEIPGAKQILYGIALGLSIMFMPHGIWPAIARRFGFKRSRDEAGEAPGSASGAVDGGDAGMGGRDA